MRRHGRRLPTRLRLALLAAAAVALAIAMATLVFTSVMRAKVEGDAIYSIESSLELGGGDDDAGHTAYYVPIYDQGEASDGEGIPSRWYNDEERALVAWARSGARTEGLDRVELDGFVVYATFVEDVWFLDEWSDGLVGAVVYVDVTDEEDLIRDVVNAFALVGGLGAAFAAIAAYTAGRRIEAAEEARKLFYENMSHELKTPLAAIRGYAEGIVTGVVEPEPGARAIMGEARRSTELVDGILGIARIEAGAVELHREPVEIADFLQDCLMPFEGLVRTRGLEVRLALGDLTVEADPTRLGHAVENIISNAVRHARTTVRIGCDDRGIYIWNDADEAELPRPDELPSLFERYRTGAGGSTGIGLALAREIVQLHGWQLTASLVEGGLRMDIRIRG